MPHVIFIGGCLCTAKELLYTEIGIALGILADAVEEYIVRKIDG